MSWDVLFCSVDATASFACAMGLPATRWRAPQTIIGMGAASIGPSHPSTERDRGRDGGHNLGGIVRRRSNRVRWCRVVDRGGFESRWGGVQRLAHQPTMGCVPVRAVAALRLLAACVFGVGLLAYGSSPRSKGKKERVHGPSVEVESFVRIPATNANGLVILLCDQPKTVSSA